jgi:hypothetical protein
MRRFSSAVPHDFRTGDILMLLGFLRPAYIDPGTGSLLIQGVVAAFVAVYFFFGSLFSKAKNAVRSLFGQRPNEDAS